MARVPTKVLLIEPIWKMVRVSTGTTGSSTLVTPKVKVDASPWSSTPTAAPGMPRRSTARSTARARPSMVALLAAVGLAAVVGLLPTGPVAGLDRALRHGRPGYAPGGWARGWPV